MRKDSGQKEKDRGCRRSGRGQSAEEKGRRTMATDSGQASREITKRYTDKMD